MFSSQKKQWPSLSLHSASCTGNAVTSTHPRAPVDADKLLLLLPNHCVLSLSRELPGSSLGGPCNVSHCPWTGNDHRNLQGALRAWSQHRRRKRHTFGKCLEVNYVCCPRVSCWGSLWPRILVLETWRNKQDINIHSLKQETQELQVLQKPGPPAPGRRPRLCIYPPALEYVGLQPTLQWTTQPRSKCALSLMLLTKGF